MQLFECMPRKPKTDSDIINVRVRRGTKQFLAIEAIKHGFKYGASGNTGAFLDAIASGEFLIVRRSDFKKKSFESA
ncbi:MAG: hypothetical protein KatS3mg087_0590 [Patescibacteria group bacterium]|nr:MAG: hypothetical protein KatS3mg087_0590 [Patescibacteria group bacterium]